MTTRTEAIIFDTATKTYWLDSSAINESAGLEEFDVIRFKGKKYELWGRRPSDGWWWINPVDDQPCGRTGDPRSDGGEAA